MSCNGKTKPVTDNLLISSYEDPGNVIKFNADSAYTFIEKQLSFGYRIPGTEDHKRALAWLAEKLGSYSDTVMIQNGTVKAFDGTILPISNIFTRLNPEKKDRILLLAHYDTRPWSDGEQDVSKTNQPLPGANDGGSGVAMILELARVLKANGFDRGIDYLLVDAEDYGVPQSMASFNDDDTWCLGTQYWIENLPYSGKYLPEYAILFDMVGGRNAKFHREFFSQRYAGQYVDKIWNAAAEAGYSDRFLNEIGNPITDDHIYLLQAGIPAIDIIENKNPVTGSFNPSWHTQSDNLENIDKNTLQAVGSTVMQAIMK